MNKRILLTAAWICVLLVGFVSPAPAQAPAGITGVNPEEGTVGTELTISGTGFGEKQGEVLIGEEKCKVLAWGESEIICQVHKPQPPGEYAITVLLQGDRKPAEPLIFYAFTMQRPKITPGELARDGNTVTVVGAFFGDKKGQLRVAYLEGGADGEGVIEDPKILDWSMQAIRFELPDGLVGKFVLGVLNEVGTGLALLDLGGGTPLLGEYEPTPPSGYGNLEGGTIASGVYFNGKFYVFSTSVPCGFSWCHPTIQCSTLNTSTGSLSACPGSMPGMYTHATPVPLVVGNKLWLFHVAGDGAIYYSVYDGANWLQIPSGGSFTPKILWYTTDKRNFEVAPVYNPVTGRVTVYHTYETFIAWGYTDDGVNWHHGGNIYPYSATGISAVYYPGVVNGKPYDTLLAFTDNLSRAFVYAVKDGVVVAQVLIVENVHTVRPFLVDLNPGDPANGSIALIFATKKAGVYLNDSDYTPVYRKMNKKDGTWSGDIRNVELPAGVRDNEIGFYYFNEYWPPNGVINYELNGSGGTDCKFYIFYGWSFSSVTFQTVTEPKWVMAPVENLGPCPGPY